MFFKCWIRNRSQHLEELIVLMRTIKIKIKMKAQSNFQTCNKILKHWQMVEMRTEKDVSVMIIVIMS